jgi:Asp-tRNA(Asn)/Glu-tRNA(Gln) amidotransferase A subunit family amidase
MELYEKTLVELMRDMSNKKITSEDVVISHISRCKNVDGALKAFEEYDFEYVLNEAKKIDKDCYAYSMKFKGIPIGVKDCYNTERMHTRRGSELYKNYTAGNDARIIRKVRDEGALILGKTKTAEFSVHHPADTVNPYDKKHTPGTSSGGSAVAVASGMVPLSFGTQTAASTSKPASYCGIYGFKPTFGVFPRTGVLKTSDTLDTLSIFARNIEDMEYAFENLRLKGEDYPYIYNNMDIKKYKKSDDSFKVALIMSDAFKGKHEYAKNALMSLKDELEGVNDLKIEIINMPDFLSRARDIHSKIYNKSLSYYFKNEYKTHSDKLSVSIKNMINDGNKISLNEYLALLNEQKMLVKKFDSWMSENYDVVLTLASGGEAPKGLVFADKLDSTLIWTLLGAPTLIVPKFKGPNNLPFGFQIIGVKYSDYMVIEFAKKLKQLGVIVDSLVVDI